VVNTRQPYLVAPARQKWRRESHGREGPDASTINRDGLSLLLFVNQIESAIRLATASIFLRPPDSASITGPSSAPLPSSSLFPVHPTSTPLSPHPQWASPSRHLDEPSTTIIIFWRAPRPLTTSRHPLPASLFLSTGAPQIGHRGVGIAARPRCSIRHIRVQRFTRRRRRKPEGRKSTPQQTVQKERSEGEKQAWTRGLVKNKSRFFQG
jgi:hypothetical protein